MSLIWSFLKHAVRSPSRPAAVDDRRQYTYAQILGGTLFMAERIEQLSQAPRVGILVPTSGAFPIALLGAWMARRTAVPFNYLLVKEELAYVIADSGVDLIITVQPMIDFLGGPEALPPSVRLLRMEDISFAGLPPLRWPPLYVGSDADKPAVILYTSGTSGKPKGVMQTHANLAANVWGGVEHARLTRADTFLGVLPQFHSFGLTAMTLIPLAVGARTVYSARFIPRRIVELMREHRPDIIMAVPSMYGALLSVKETGPDDFRSVRFAISGGEPLPNAVFEECRRRFELTLLEGYGLTETSPVVSWATPTRSRLHSVGQVLPFGTVAIVDENNQPLPPNHDGEILVAGPNLMKGYYKLPELTRQVMVQLPPIPDEYLNGQDPRGERYRGRWFRTGDIGRLDPQGFLYITGRKKEMLIIAGENVFPREIEEVLNQHPTVKDSAVIGMTDGLRGEVPVAFVEMQADQTLDEKELRTWCRQRLAGYKVPREIRQLDALPRNPTGKILRRQLRVD